MTTVAVRLPDEILTFVDELIAQGNYANRTEAVKAGLTAIIREYRGTAIDRQILAGYEASPETPGELAAARDSTRALIAEEPW